MGAAFIIETTRQATGLAIRELNGFRFYAADAQFQAFDNCTFRGLRALRIEVDRLAAQTPVISAQRAGPSPAG